MSRSQGPIVRRLHRVLWRRLLWWGLAVGVLVAIAGLMQVHPTYATNAFHATYWNSVAVDKPSGQQYWAVQLGTVYDGTGGGTGVAAMATRWNYATFQVTGNSMFQGCQPAQANALTVCIYGRSLWSTSESLSGSSVGELFCREYADAWAVGACDWLNAQVSPLSYYKITAGPTRITWSDGLATNFDVYLSNSSPYPDYNGSVDVWVVWGGAGYTDTPEESSTPTLTVTPSVTPMSTCDFPVATAGNGLTAQPLVPQWPDATHAPGGSGLLEFDCAAGPHCSAQVDRNGSMIWDAVITAGQNQMMSTWHAGDTWTCSGNCTVKVSANQACNSIGAGASMVPVDISPYVSWHDTDAGCIQTGVKQDLSRGINGWQSKICVTVRTLDKLAIGNFDLMPFVNLALAGLVVVFIVFLWKRG